MSEERKRPADVPGEAPGALEDLDRALAEGGDWPGAVPPDLAMREASLALEETWGEAPSPPLQAGFDSSSPPASQDEEEEDPLMREIDLDTILTLDYSPQERIHHDKDMFYRHIGIGVGAGMVIGGVLLAIPGNTDYKFLWYVAAGVGLSILVHGLSLWRKISLHKQGKGYDRGPQLIITTHEHDQEGPEDKD